MARKPPFSVVYFEWLDAASPDDAGWTDLKKVQSTFEPHLCYTCGFLIKETKDYIIVAASISPATKDGISDTKAECGDFITIPKGWIKKRKKLL